MDETARLAVLEDNQKEIKHMTEKIFDKLEGISKEVVAVGTQQGSIQKELTEHKDKHPKSNGETKGDVKILQNNIKIQWVLIVLILGAVIKVAFF